MVQTNQKANPDEAQHRQDKATNHNNIYHNMAMIKQNSNSDWLHHGMAQTNTNANQDWPQHGTDTANRHIQAEHAWLSCNVPTARYTPYMARLSLRTTLYTLSITHKTIQAAWNIEARQLQTTTCTALKAHCQQHRNHCTQTFNIWQCRGEQR